MAATGPDQAGVRRRARIHGAKQAYVARYYDDGWGFPHAAAEMAPSQRERSGDHWRQWLSSPTPALLMHGTKSTQLSTEHAEQMARRRADTTLVHIDGGHALDVDNPIDYDVAVRKFLAALSTTR